MGEEQADSVLMNYMAANGPACEWWEAPDELAGLGSLKRLETTYKCGRDHYIY
jgi:hypothetical protein